MLGLTLHRYIFLFGISILGGAMLFGEVSTSVAQFILFGNWLLEGKFRWKLQTLKSNRVFWVLASLYLLHLAGLLYTDSMYWALRDLRIKIPLLLLPLVFFSSRPLSLKELHNLLYLFVTGIVLSSFWCLYYNYTHEVNDARDISRFISHIRFGLFINMGICSLVYFIITSSSPAKRILYALVIVYLYFFMVKISLVTGLVLSAILAAVFTVYIILKQPLKIKLVSFLVFALVTFFLVYLVKAKWEDFTYVDTSEKNQPKAISQSGRPYSVIRSNRHTENGFYIAYNIQYDEMEAMWHKRSKIYIYSKDAKGNPIAGNLIRYLASKGLTKDSAGVAGLSEEDIRNVEKGANNYKYVNASPVEKRIRELFWEYEDYREGINPSGNTLLMRMEFWKTGMYIFKTNLLFGVGTGDDWKTFEKAYEETNSRLIKDWRLKSHNQFLAIAVSFGMIGLIIFLVYLFYPLVKLYRKLHPLYVMFFAIAVISFLTEDTLETQTGVTFFAYFNTLFLWMASAGEKDDQKL